MKKYLSKGIVISLILTSAACNGNEQQPTNDKTVTPETNIAQTAATPPAAANENVLKGKVLESMDSGGYTYLQIDTGTSQPWVAIPQSVVTVGEEVNCSPGMEMKNFSSKTLDRTFDSIIFSGGLIGGTQAAAKTVTATQGQGDSFASAVKAEGGAPMAQQQPEGSGGSLGAMAPFSAITMEKASGENGYTVEEIFTKTEELDGKTVRIQGKVIKVSANIMGRNWIHLQDGTGDPASNTHDLVITSSETFTVDDIVTIEGVLAANKDFGAGYKYASIVEEAKAIK